MKKIVNIFLFSIILISVSCKDKVKDIETQISTNFDLANIAYVADSTIEFQSDFGQIIKVVGKNFEFYIVLSDTISKTFNAVYYLAGADSGRACCVIKIYDTYRFASNGTVEYDLEKKSGTFDIVLDNLDIIKGTIITDTIIHHPFVDFTKISMTDPNAWPIDSADSSDWGIRTDFGVIERLAFNLKTAETIPGSIVLHAYPNPTAGIISIQADIPDSDRTNFVLVNENFEIEKKLMRLEGGFNQISLGDGLYSEKYYRLYYKISSDTEQHYGSGDIKIEK